MTTIKMTTCTGCNYKGTKSCPYYNNESARITDCDSKDNLDCNVFVVELPKYTVEKVLTFPVSILPTGMKWNDFHIIQKRKHKYVVFYNSELKIRSEILDY